MQVNSAGGRGGGQHAARTGQNREQMSARDGIARSEGRNEWTRAGGSDGGRQFFLLADSGLPVPASLRSSDIHQVCLSLLLDSRSTEGPFLKIRPLLPLAPLQIKWPTLKGIPRLADLRWETAVTDEWALLWTGKSGPRRSSRRTEKERERGNLTRWRKKRGRMH